MNRNATQNAAAGCLAFIMTASMAWGESIKLDIDLDGRPDEVSRVIVEGDPVLQFSMTSGAQLQVHGIGFESVGDLHVLPPVDLDGDGKAELVISDPTLEEGRVWIFSGGAVALGTLDASSPTLTLQSSMPGAIRFGDSLGLLPGPEFGDPPCLRVRSYLQTCEGTLYSRAEVFRLDTQRLLLVAEGPGALTSNWKDRADATRDGRVDADDLVSSLSRVGLAASYDGDLDGDGWITNRDVVLVLTAALLDSNDVESDWQSVTRAMLDRAGGIDAWGMPIDLVSVGTEAQPEEPESEGTGVFYCARPLKNCFYENWAWWLAPFCHAYLQIGDWSDGIGGGEDLDDDRSRKCWEATKSEDGTMVVDGETIDCADATNEQIQQCVKDLAAAGGVCSDYDIICNNCGDWVMDILEACCLEGSYLPYLIY